MSPLIRECTEISSSLFNGYSCVASVGSILGVQPSLRLSAPFAGMSRASNSSTPAEVKPLIKEVYGPDGARLQEGTFGSLGQFLDTHVEFIIRLLQLPPVRRLRC